MASSTPPHSDHRNALAKGLGRALLDTRNAGRLIDEEAVLDACLHNRSYDPQCEDSRAPWLLEILEAAGELERLREPILRALSDPRDDWDCVQLCDWAEIFARRGSETARQFLYGIVQNPEIRSHSSMGYKQLIRTDGVKGFLHCAEHLGQIIRLGEEPWETLFVAREAEEHCGVDAVASALSSGASANGDTRIYFDALMKERQRSETPPKGLSRADKMRTIPLAEVRESIENPNPDLNGYYLSVWGRYAAKEDLDPLAASLFEENDPVKITRYLRVFSRRSLPDFDHRLIGLAAHKDKQVRFWAMRALSANTHPAVRNYALTKMQAGPVEDETISLLIQNYREGDHKFIEMALKVIEDRDKMHRVCWGIQDVFRANKTTDGTASLLFSYEANPCSLCRSKDVELLLELNRAPEWLIEECAFDANLGTRELLKPRTGSNRLDS